MTVRIQEPTPERDISGVESRTRQLARRPSPVRRGGSIWPQVILALGSTDADDNVWMPVPLWYYWKRNDPDDLYFEIEQTDEGDTGNDYWRIRLGANGQNGRYMMSCMVSWNQVGTAPFVGYEHLEVNFWNDAENLVISSFPNDNAWSGEQSAYQIVDCLFDAGAFWSAGNDGGVVCKPRARQTSGVTRTLGGEFLKLTWYDDMGDPDDDWVSGVIGGT